MGLLSNRSTDPPVPEKKIAALGGADSRDYSCAGRWQMSSVSGLNPGTIFARLGLEHNAAFGRTISIPTQTKIPSVRIDRSQRTCYDPVIKNCALISRGRQNDARTESSMASLYSIGPDIPAPARDMTLPPMRTVVWRAIVRTIRWKRQQEPASPSPVVQRDASMSEAAVGR